jgi:serine/threonine-protein kinase
MASPAVDRVDRLLTRLIRVGVLSAAKARQYQADMQHWPEAERNPDHFLAHLLLKNEVTSLQIELLTDPHSQLICPGGYLILEKIGSGGMSQVYLARHRISRQPAAVKVLKKQHVDEPTTRERFVREARAATLLDHPHIVKLLAMDHQHDPPFIVMEYVDGMSLQALVALHGTLTEGETATCAIQIASALAHAADHGMIHRDVKPANVMLTRNGTLKLLDLGIVRDLTQPGLTMASDGNRPILGTVDYLAPEQYIDSSSVNTAADIYSLGATLYFLLAGHPPFPEGNQLIRLNRKLESRPKPIHHLRPDVSFEFSQLLSRMLEPNPHDRLTSPHGLMTAFKPFSEPLNRLLERVYIQWPDALANAVIASPLSPSGDTVVMEIPAQKAPPQQIPHDESRNTDQIQINPVMMQELHERLDQQIEMRALLRKTRSSHAALSRWLVLLSMCCGAVAALVLAAVLVSYAQ